MSAESLVLLCAKTACLDPRGWGGRGALRPEDIALALGGLAEKVFLFGLYTVVNDHSVQHELVYHAHLEAVDLAIAQGWRAPTGSMVCRKMAILALCEVVGVSCAGCERRGSVQDEKGVAGECLSCGGSGLRRFTDAEREEALGVRGWRWLGRYDLVYRRISAWQTTLDNHLRRRLRPDPTLLPIPPRGRPTAPPIDLGLAVGVAG